MAGMFYNLQEVIEKLGKTEEEIKELIKNGKLREFRDGTGLLFKAAEVDDLITDTSGLDFAETGTEVELIPDETGEESVVPQEAAADAGSEETDIAAQLEEVAAATAAGSEEPEAAAGPKEAEPEEDINIDDLTAGDVNLGELTGADTNITTAGINILAETEDDYKLTEDTKAETKLSKAPQQSEALDTLGSDLSLDSVGSGSGLLDLSLQADDTSLGAVLDDILPAVGEEEPAAATPEG